MENHGCISFDVVVEGAGWGCVFGGYSLGHGYLGAKEFRNLARESSAIQ